MINSQNNLELESIITDNEFNIISNFNNVSLVVFKIDSISGFDFGLVVEIVIRTAIGISTIFIFKQKKQLKNRTRFITNLSSNPA